MTTTLIITVNSLISDLQWNVSTAQQCNQWITSRIKNYPCMVVRASRDVVQAPRSFQLSVNIVVFQQLNQSLHRTVLPAITDAAELHFKLNNDIIFRCPTCQPPADSVVTTRWRHLFGICLWVSGKPRLQKQYLVKYLHHTQKKFRD